MSVTASVEKIDTRSNIREMVKEYVASEVLVNIFVNNEHVITLLASPRLQKELALGWLFGEGILQSIDELKGITVKQNDINVITEHPLKKELTAFELTKTHTSSGGLSGNRFLDDVSKGGYQWVESNYKIKSHDIIRFVQELDKGILYRSTRGVHIAAIFEKGELVAFAEDIGRHNAVDKAVGIAIQSNVELSNSVLVSSGRQPADMVLKAARMKIPIVASIAAPISSGIAVAEKTGITLVCFVDERQMKVFTHPARIL